MIEKTQRATASSPEDAREPIKDILKTMAVKMAGSGGIQEYIEPIRDLKVCNAETAYLGFVLWSEQMADDAHS